MLKGRIFRCAALVGLLGLGFASGLKAQTPLVEYKFNETGTTAANTGSLAAADNLTLQAIGGAAADLHTADALGVSGKPGDRALDLTGAPQMGAGGAGPLAATPMGANPIQTQNQFTVSGWFKASSVVINRARILDGGNLVVLASNDTSTSGLIRF